MPELTFRQKIWLFSNTFKGLTNVYGTYDPISGKSWQVKQRVNGQVIHDHLRGKRPFGVYLLTGQKVKAVAADFDQKDLLVPVEFVARLLELDLHSYIEVSKSKGYHVWLFFDEFVDAASVRSIIRKILTEMDRADVEVFPKQDKLQNGTAFGNFINAPLFGRLVLEGKTAFLDLDNMPNLCDDQWQFLQNAKRHNQADIDKVLSCHNIQIEYPKAYYSDEKSDDTDSFGLVPCVRTILQQGVDSYQRSTCFRLAVRLRKIGLPCDITIAALEAWAAKNNPIEGKRIITPQEIHHQVESAYKKTYSSFGCEQPEINRYCDESCPVLKAREKGS